VLGYIRQILKSRLDHDGALQNGTRPRRPPEGFAQGSWGARALGAGRLVFLGYPLRQAIGRFCHRATAFAEEWRETVGWPQGRSAHPQRQGACGAQRHFAGPFLARMAQGGGGCDGGTGGSTTRPWPVPGAHARSDNRTGQSMVREERFFGKVRLGSRGPGPCCLKKLGPNLGPGKMDDLSAQSAMATTKLQYVSCGVPDCPAGHAAPATGEHFTPRGYWLLSAQGSRRGGLTYGGRQSSWQAGAPVGRRQSKAVQKRRTRARRRKGRERQTWPVAAEKTQMHQSVLHCTRAKGSSSGGIRNVRAAFIWGRADARGCIGERGNNPPQEAQGKTNFLRRIDGGKNGSAAPQSDKAD